MAPWRRTVAGSGRLMKVLRRMLRGLGQLWVYKTPLVVLVSILVFLPLPLVVSGKESRCAYVLMVMAVLWLTEALPIPVTALLPVFMFPMAGILTAKEAGLSYFSDTSMLFIGGLVVAIGVEECNLHKRLALAVLRRVGADPKWIMLGLMLPTWFLSMWISNTATASMMIPIVEAVLLQIKQASDASPGIVSKGARDDSMEMEELSGERAAFIKGTKSANEADDTPLGVEIHPRKAVQENRTPAEVYGEVDCIETSSLSDGAEDAKTKKGKDEEQKLKEQHHAHLAKGLCLCIAYAANVGGIATLTGTPPNLVLKGQVDIFFEKYGAESPLTFVEWMGLGFPLSLLLLVLCWLWLVLIFLKGCCRGADERQKQAVRETIQEEYKAMGSMSFAERETLVLFFLLALLWITRDPKFVSGWSILFESSYVSDATGAIMIAVLFFILPSRKPHIFCWKPLEGEEEDAEVYQPLLTWDRAQDKLPWGIIILLGGGFALAKACKYSGLSLWVGIQLSAFGDMEPWVLNMIICIAVAMATEVTSNVATATLLMPIMAELAIRINVNPMYLMASSALATSFAFMMPVATPPNAIVFSHGHLSIPDMAKTGFMMNVFAVAVLTLAVNTWGDAIFNFSTVPDIMITGKNVTVDQLTTTLAP